MKAIVRYKSVYNIMRCLYARRSSTNTLPLRLHECTRSSSTFASVNMALLWRHGRAPEQLPESVWCDVGDANVSAQSRRRVVRPFIVPRRPRRLLLLTPMLWWRRRRRWRSPAGDGSDGQRSAQHREENGTARHEHVAMTADRHRKFFAGSATWRQQREPDVAVDLIVQHVAVRLGQCQIVLPVVSARWHHHRRRRRRWRRRHLSSLVMGLSHTPALTLRNQNHNKNRCLNPMLNTR